jgi:putative addiction module component (TIGR02574 family)
MTAIALDLFSAALSLPEGDRLELASRLIASVDGEADPQWDEAWLTELDRREQAVAEGGDPGSSWTEVKARLLGRLGSR